MTPAGCNGELGRESGPSERGFSLVELMVVLSILSILMGIAIPIFLHARVPAQNRQAQSLLRYALTAARELYSDSGSYLNVTLAGLVGAETSVTFVDGATSSDTSARQVSVRTGTVGPESFIIFASKSAAGDCFAALDADRSPTKFQQVSSATCAANDFDPTVGWVDSWS